LQELVAWVNRMNSKYKTLKIEFNLRGQVWNVNLGKGPINFVSI